jgi:platelet-activating factor acetylhydrolase
LSTAPSPLPDGDGRYRRLPVRRVLALDPWMEPFASPGPEPYKDTEESKAGPVELLIINSEAFTLWTGHFNTLQETVAKFAPSRLITLVRAQHVTFSDFPLLVPRPFQETDPHRLVDCVGLLAHRFLIGTLSFHSNGLGAADGGVQTRSMKIIKDEKAKRRLEGEAGDIILH